MSTKRIILVVLVCLAAGLLVLQVASQPGLMQFAFLPPALQEEQPASEQDQQGQKQAPSPLEQFLKSWQDLQEEQQDNVKAALISAHLPQVLLSTPQGGSTQAELTALYGQAHTLEASVLINGRQLYQEELDTGSPVAVIDEALAIALFRQGNPVDMQFEMLGQQFTVVGIVQHRRGLGERAEYGLRVPLKAFLSSPSFEVMTAQLLPKGGSGTRAGLARTLSEWQKGQAIDLVKEKYRATLPLRVLLCGLGLVFSALALKLAARVSSRLVAKARSWLETEYFVRLIPRYLVVALAMALMFSAGLALLLFSFTQLLSVVYVFPEWVPAILVEPRELIKTFWDNRSQASSLLSLRSRELLQLQALHSYLRWLCVALALLVAAPIAGLFKKVQKPKEEI